MPISEPPGKQDASKKTRESEKRYIYFNIRKLKTIHNY